MKVIHIISFEPISNMLTSTAFHKPFVKLVKIHSADMDFEVIEFSLFT